MQKQDESALLSLQKTFPQEIAYYVYNMYKHVNEFPYVNKRSKREIQRLGNKPKGTILEKELEDLVSCQHFQKAKMIWDNHNDWSKGLFLAQAGLGVYVLKPNKRKPESVVILDAPTTHMCEAFTTVQDYLNSKGIITHQCHGWLD
jgi:hypothetical protein